MVRFGKIEAITTTCCVVIALQSPIALTQGDQAQLEQYLQEIEQLISDNNIEGARNKLTEALAEDLRDESLDVVQGQLRLLESLNDSNNVAVESGGALTATDKTAATDLLDSLRVAMENGELEKVRLFTDPTPKTDSLLTAVFDNYAAMRIEVSPPEADEETQSFLATLEFKELTTKNGDTAFPAQAWKTHRLRIIRSEGSWQKVLW